MDVSLEIPKGLRRPRAGRICLLLAVVVLVLLRMAEG